MNVLWVSTRVFDNRNSLRHRPFSSAFTSTCAAIPPNSRTRCAPRHIRRPVHGDITKNTAKHRTFQISFAQLSATGQTNSLPKPIQKFINPMASVAPRIIAVIYATKGGMGDVGKFAAVHALKDPTVTPRVISMAAGSVEGGGDWVDADVTDTELAAQLKADFKDISVQHIDIEAEDAQTKLETAFEGVEAVVACLGSRQPSFGRWISSGASAVIKAMEKTHVKRLVQLSSMGIGEDFMPFKGIRVLWAGMLRTIFRPAFSDLTNMEVIVQASDADYLLVRPVGLTPEEPPRGSWKLLTSRENGGLDLNIAKSDCGAFMLQEALNPTFVRTAVTIGQPEKASS